MGAGCGESLLGIGTAARQIRNPNSCLSAHFGLDSDSDRVKFWRANGQSNARSAIDETQEVAVSDSGCQACPSETRILPPNYEGNINRGFLFFNFVLVEINKMSSLINFRRRRRQRLNLRFVMLLFLFIKLLEGHRQAGLVHAQRQPETTGQEQPTPPSFYNEPQPFVYLSLHEAGSGSGPNNFNQNQDLSSSSSSISPSLIMAKCWNNNNDNDNDCRQLNVISANDQQRQHQPLKPEDDDSIITPVVIFESSSSLEAHTTGSSPPAFLAPPYFSSTERVDSNNVVLARHRTPPTANDIHSAPPAGATILPATIGIPTVRQSHSSWANPQTTASPGIEQSATRPSLNSFVATPQPKKPLKTTTMGRKCRDENDEDCDEPEEEDLESGRKVGAESKQATSTGSDRNSAHEEGDESSDDISSTGNAELGSGDRPSDDNENDGDDDDSYDNLDGSSGSEPPQTDQTTHLIEVNQSYRPTRPSAVDNFSQPYAGDQLSTTHGAQIEVVVHPTLPPTFPITTQLSSTKQANNLHDETSTRFDDSNDSKTTSDTWKSNPVFPSSEWPESTSSESTRQQTPSSGGHSSFEEATTDQNQNQPMSSTELDLATFVPIPMPPIETNNGRHSSDFLKNNASNYVNNENGENRIADKHKFDANPTNVVPLKFENPWKAQPVRPVTYPTQAAPEEWQSSQRPRTRQDSRAESALSRTQSDTLPTLILYASVVIITVTFLIFVIVVVANRRNTARQRALLLKSNLFGGPGPDKMVASLSHGSQLMANMQQPGLLSTYGPMKGSNMGKITTSVVKVPSDGVVGGEDEAHVLENDQSREMADGSMGESVRRNCDQGTSSWSTEEQTTSNGSQKNDGQQPHQGNDQQRLQYPNSLSDGQQNSSSISDSHGSPTETNPDYQANHSPNSRYTQQQQPLSAYHGRMPQQQRPPDFGPQLPGYYEQQQPTVIENNVTKFNSSRSVENLHQHPYAITQQPPNLDFVPRQQQQMINQAVHKPPLANCPPTQRAYLLNDGPANLGTSDGYAGVNGVNHRYGLGLRSDSIDFQTSRPMSPGRLNMSPSATIGRRYHPAMALNRGIYSEDSSSLMTASPSLARTSSSSSFAFNSGQLPPTIRPKPQVDAAGRKFNDYTQADLNGTGRPPVFGRKDHSEAWYV